MKAIRPEWLFDESPIPDPHGRAARVLAFADLLRHPKAAGRDRRPLRDPWQRRLIQRIYGPSDETGRRATRLVYAELPRGARKTTLASVLALAHTIGPEQRPYGQVVAAAADRTQARLAFDEACAMLKQDVRLLDAVRIRDTKNRVEHNRSRSAFVATSAEGDFQHGKTPSFVLADELHVWRGYDMWNVLKTGASKVAGSLTIVITTAGKVPAGICWELRKVALAAAANPAAHPTILPVVFAADPEKDDPVDAWLDEDLWAAVNPGLAEGYPDLDELRAEAALARHIPPLRRAFQQVHLNIWGDGSAAGWVDMAIYDEAGEPLEPDALAGRSAWIGVDLSKAYDLTAIAAAFPDGEGGVDLLVRAFLPEAAYQRRATETPDLPWEAWREAGHLTVMPGDVIDDAVIEDAIRDWCEEFDVQEIAFDPKFAAKIMSRLVDDELPAVSVPQTRVITSPFYTEMQKAIIGRRLRHGGNPVLRWAMGNAVPDVGDSGLVYIGKRRAVESIDPLVAAAIAFGRATAGGTGMSVYDDEDERPDGLLVI